MAACPNKNSIEWKILVQDLGNIEAFRVWEDYQKERKEKYDEDSDENAFPIEVSAEQRQSFIENKGKTQEDVLSQLEKTQKKIKHPEEENWIIPEKGHPLSKLREGSELKVPRYFYINERGEREIVSHRVTDIQDLMFRRNKTREEADKINNYYKNVILRERGVDLHKVLQYITNARKVGKEPVRPSFLSPLQFEELKNGATIIHKDIKKVQNTIDKDGTVVILTETILHDPLKDRAGSTDVLAIFSDGSVAIYDFKFVNFVTQNGKVVDYENKIDMKEESWDAQMSEYKRTLRDVYGVDLVRRSRVIPINVQYQYRQEKGKQIMTDQIYNLEMGNQEYTAPIPLADELTDDKKLNNLLKSLLGLKSTLQKTKAGTKDREALTARIRRVQEGIRNMQLKKDFTFFINEITAISNEVQNGIAINDEEDPRYISLKQLDFYKKSLGVYKTLATNTKATIANKKGLSEEEREELSKQAADATTVAILAYETIQDKQTEILQSRGEGRGIKDVLSIQKETAEGFLVSGNQGKYFSDWTHPIFRLVQEEIYGAWDTTRHELKEVQDEIKRLTDNLTKWGKQNGYSGTDVFNPIINPKTGDLVTEFTAEFWEERKEAIEGKDERWLKENYEQTEEDKKAYEKAEKEQKIYIERTWKNKSESWRNSAFVNWQKKHNPEYNRAWYHEWTLIKYLTLRDPKKWRSKEYEFIQNNKPLKEFYDYHTKLNLEFVDILPKDTPIKKYSIANIHRDMIDTLAENGVNMSTIKDMWMSFIQTMEIREDDVSFGMIDTLTGEKIARIPILYTKYLTNTKGAPDNKLKSKNLGRSLSLFAQMAYNYKNIEKIEDLMLLAKGVLATQDQYLVNKWGKIILDETTANPAVGEGNKATVNSLDSYLRAFMYGEKIQSNDKLLEMEGNNISATKIIKNTMGFYSLTRLGLSVVSGFGALVGATANMYQTGSKRKYYTNRDVMFAEGEFVTGSKKAFAAFDYFEATHEDIRKRKSNLLSVSRMAKTLSLDHAYIMLRKADSSVEATITVAMMRHYGVNAKGKIEKLSRIRKKEGKDVKSIWEMSSVDEKGNLVVKINGEDMTTAQQNEFRRLVMYVATTVKGNYSNEDLLLANTKLEGQLIMQFRNWMPRLISERFRDPRYLENIEEIELGRFRVFAGEIIRKKGVSISAFINIAIEVASFSLIKHKLSQGQSTRYFDEFLANNPDLEEKIRRGELDREELFEYYKEERIGQMRAFAREIQMYTLVIGAMAAMGVDWDEDGEKLYKEIPGGPQFLKLLNKASMELGFLFRPSEAGQLLRSPIPVIGILLDIERLVSNSLDETRDFVARDDYKGFFFWEKDPNDKTPMFKYTSKFVPFWKPAADFFEAFEPSEEEKGKTKLEALITD